MPTHFARRKQLELQLSTHDPSFINPPAHIQRNWVISRAMDELADDLLHLDHITKKFVAGEVRKEITEDWTTSKARYDEEQLIINGQQVMQAWEQPYMKEMAKVVTETHGDVLEIGFGMGISASYIQAFGVKSYTVIECSKDVRVRFEDWKKQYPQQDIRLEFGKWQEVIEQLGKFDGIFFDTYPLSEQEFADYVIQDVTFAQHFFAIAARHLREGGIFTYYSNEIDSVSRRHQRELFKYFKSISFSICKPLSPPQDCNYWWADSMVVTRCIK